MDLIAHWNDLVRYYGERINQYEYLLAKASDTTYALLACKWVPEEGPIFGSYRGEHAEEQLINSPVWTQQIMSALGDWTELNRDPIIVTLALNRSPCGHCAMALTKALKHVQSAFSLRFEYHSFILASRGLYIGRGFMRDDKLDERTVTTDRSLDLLLDAGWKLCVLQFGDELPARGRELLQGLHRKNR